MPECRPSAPNTHLHRVATALVLVDPHRLPRPRDRDVEVLELSLEDRVVNGIEERDGLGCAVPDVEERSPLGWSRRTVIEEPVSEEPVYEAAVELETFALWDNINR